MIGQEQAPAEKRVEKTEEKKEERAEEKKKEEEEKNAEEEKKPKSPPPPPPPLVLYVDLHCVGCAKKIERSILRLRGAFYLFFPL